MRKTEPSRHVRRGSLLLAVILVSAPACFAHDIPNARVDRSIQITLRPGRVTVAYEVSLSELTLTQELRTLIGALPGSDRAGWFAAYGRETGPLNAKGLLAWSNGEPLTLESDGFDLAVEEHPRYTFRYTAAIPPRGDFRIQDTNFASSEGTSRLAVRGQGVAVRGDELPPDVEAIPARPVWQLSDDEERRTREVRVEYETSAGSTAPRSETERGVHAPRPQQAGREGNGSPLSRLLDKTSRLPSPWLALVALMLGAAHAFQPGHGKTLVAATVVAEGGRWLSGALLGVSTTLAHAGSVFLVAAALWWTGSVDFAGVHVILTRTSGFVIAAVGLWRVGRMLGGFAEHAPESIGPDRAPRGVGRTIGLGMAGGLVPCWDAVGLVMMAAAVGRLGLGLALVASFSVGMGLVLVAVGWAVARLRVTLEGVASEAAWGRRLGLASGVVLSALGIFLMRL